MLSTISSTAWNVVTALLLINFAAFAKTESSCAVRRSKIPALRLYALDAKAMAKWSSDFLLQSVLAIDDDYLPYCPGTGGIEAKASDAMKQEYLTRLGTAGDAELFFGLLAPQDDHATLKKRLAMQKPQKTAEATLRALYGFAEKVRGVWVLGATSAAIAEIGKILDAVCTAECVFWNPHVLHRVLVTDAEGIAAYIPETASLMLSTPLLEHPTALTHVVVTHELAHAAARLAWSRDRADWGAPFAKFSGWKTDKHGGLSLKVETLGDRPVDDIIKQSEESKFSVTPDPVLRPKGEDGFVFAKSYRETEEHHEPAEDMADSVAAYRWAPERFCFAGKPLAPEKFKWVEANVTFPAYKATPTCVKRSR